MVQKNKLKKLKKQNIPEAYWSDSLKAQLKQIVLIICVSPGLLIGLHSSCYKLLQLLYLGNFRTKYECKTT